MGARYPWYILADSPEGQRKEWEVRGKQPPPSLPKASPASSRGAEPRGDPVSAAVSNEWIASPSARNEGKGAAGDDDRAFAPTRGDIRHGFVYERVPHITLKSIANNAEIDVIWERY